MPDHRIRRFVLTLAAAAVPALPAAAQSIEIFQEIRGELEFSGVMIARPLQAKDAVERRMSDREQLAATETAIRELMGFDIVNYFPEVDEYLIRVPKGETESTVSTRLMATGAFAYVEPDWIVYPIGCPNDPGFGTQWHHQASRMNSCAAWDLETGNPSVVVAICDTGIRTGHTDLRSHRYEGFNVPTQKWESQGGAINDINGHGTNCTGSAAGNGNNGVGVSGAGWNLGHRMMRVTDSADGSASISNLTLAARTAADRGDKVASVSYSGVNNSTVFTTGTYVRSKNALLVWAAGNSNVNLSGNREDDVIVVGASDQNDLKASFSNYGTLVDLFAPGVSIYTTSNAGDTSYASVSGTSFACPITAGLCGLIWSRNPTLTPAQVEQILRSTCVDLGTAGVDGTFGYGRISSAAAIAATPPSTPDTTPPSAPGSVGALAGYGQITLNWIASPESDVAGYRVYRSGVTGGPYTEVTSALVSTTSYVNTGLAAGATFFYVVAAQDFAGNLSVSSGEASATVPNTPSPQLLFADGFESASFTAGGWVASSTSLVTATPAAAAAGSYGARVARNATLTKSRSTVGFGSIQVKYTRRTAGYESSEFLRLEWWNGSAWTQVEATRVTAFGAVTFDLPAGASNLAAFQVRFRSSGNRTDEWGDVDAVEIWGTPLP